MADSVSAVIALLKSAELADGRIFGGRLPDNQTSAMPRACILVRAAGASGAFGGGYLATTDERVDVRAYHASEYEAHKLMTRISSVLHHVESEKTPAGRVLWCSRSGGPIQTVEPDTNWPFSLTSWQVFGHWLPEEVNE